ncbi:hypothetical protein [Halobacillus campisalis]|uniref:PDGLE domain-containing protein n=1 Tax=Halobacillus campisalis TaxID=435909 RepID=A0ABW2K5D6_9BACI|nr:hypothetical protein [Halobacillus campisalis]
MKGLFITMIGLILFVSGSLYGISQTPTPVEEKVVEVSDQEACLPEVNAEEAPLIAKFAYGLGEGVSHGFDFILILLSGFFGG